jgi:RNA polymerase sigma-70 factor (ECF subfamily)
LWAIQRGDSDALSHLINKYGAYVATVVHNIIGGQMSYEDVEEVTSDVFLALSQNADKPKATKLKAYLGSIARNKAKNKLRECCIALPLEDDFFIVDGDNLEDEIISNMEQQAVHHALYSMEQPDKDIFLRHYYGLQTVQTIAVDMNMTVSAVKQRLSRGREKLRAILEKEMGT